MNDDYPSDTLDRMFDTVNEGLKWSVEQVRSACPWRQKKEDGPKSPDGDTQKGATDDEKQSKASARIGGKQSKDSAQAGDKQSKDSARAGDDDDASKRGEHLKKREQPEADSDKSGKYAAPSQICPPREPPCCFIKMQDPCSPCCCDNKPPPCLSTHADPPRDPTCGCDLCKKGYPNDRCCDHREAFRRATTGPRYFEKA